jgi:hypothetical protein
MESPVDFIVYCIEEYKYMEHLSGKEVIDLFKKRQVIPYIRSYYDALHTMGGLAIVDDIKGLIE